MIRVIVFLIAVGVLALGAAWLADRPGDLIVTWQGMRMKTSPLVMAAALLVAVAVLVFVWSIVRAIVRSPAVLAKRRRERRGALRAAEPGHFVGVLDRGQRADLLATGLIQLGDGGGLAEELLRIARRERLQGRVQPGAHVVFRGQLRDGLLAAGQRRRVPGGGLLGDLGVGLRAAELDAQAVVLLAQGVDLEFQLLGLRDQGGQAGLRRGGLRHAVRGGDQQGQRGRGGGQGGRSAQFAHSDARYWIRGPSLNRLGRSFTLGRSPAVPARRPSGYRGRRYGIHDQASAHPRRAYDPQAHRFQCGVWTFAE